MKPILLIPARMASTRLPGKPLADIGGVPMIGSNLSARSRSSLGIEPSRPQVYGCCGRRKMSSVGPYSAVLPAYMTMMSSAS